MSKPISYDLRRPIAGPPLPVVFDSPHSGESLPPGFQTVGSADNRALLCDRYVDRLLALAPEHGVAVLSNPWDRIYIDLNSRETAIDPTKLRGVWPGPHTLSELASEQGLGLIASALVDRHGRLHQLFNTATSPTVDDVKDRIVRHYRPYYTALHRLMDEAVKSHGFAVHFNFHSTPRAPFMRFKGVQIGEVIIGNRDKKTCHTAVTDFACDFFAREGLHVMINDPFKGGALTEATGKPAQGRHSLQIEILRDLYMDPQTLDPHPDGMARVQMLMGRLCRELALFTRDQATKLLPSP